MIQKMTHTTIFVADQEAAKEFYVKTLGFHLVKDVEMGPSFRWVTVSPPLQPELEIVLMAVDSHPSIDEESKEALHMLLKKGVLGMGVFGTPNCKETYQQLKDKGVEFSWEPKEQFYGVETWMKDNSGNGFSVCEAK